MKIEYKYIFLFNKRKWRSNDFKHFMKIYISVFELVAYTEINR